LEPPSVSADFRAVEKKLNYDREKCVKMQKEKKQLGIICGNRVFGGNLKGGEGGKVNR